MWHGGCPNLSGEVRFLPSMELCSGAYHRHLQAGMGQWVHPFSPRALESFWAKRKASNDLTNRVLRTSESFR